MVGKVAPDWKYLNGNVKKISDYRDTMILVEFSTQRCGFCNRAKKYLKEIDSTYKKRNFKFIEIEFESFYGYINGKRPESNLILEGVVDGKDIFEKYNLGTLPAFPPFIFSTRIYTCKVIFPF